MIELKEYAGIANRILQKSNNYIRSKEIISSAYKSKIEEFKREEYLNSVIFRLTIIDSYYSTQMNKRLFGIDDLAEKIVDVANYNDEKLKAKCVLFLNEQDSINGIQELFNCDKYGIQKTGESFGQASSLISKYLYFLMDYKFPIYDRLARVSYNKIIANKKIISKYKLKNLKAIDNKFDIQYFSKLTKLKNEFGIESYNEFDNLLWLIGKITDGSLHLVLGRKLYGDLIQRPEVKNKIEGIKQKNKKQKKENSGEIVKKEIIIVDNILRDYIRSCNRSELFNGDMDLIKFFDFSLDYFEA